MTRENNRGVHENRTTKTILVDRPTTDQPSDVHYKRQKNTSSVSKHKTVRPLPSALREV